MFIDSFYLAVELTLIRLEPIKSLQELLMVNQSFLRRRHPILRLNNLIVEPELLIHLIVESAMYLLVLLCELVLAGHQPGVHLVDSLQELLVRIFDVVLHLDYVLLDFVCVCGL